jgi:hypothetical protein
MENPQQVFGSDEKIQFLKDTFSERTLLEMGLALDKACERLSYTLDHHENRRVIAARIIARVEEGERTFGGMVMAGLTAVDELLGKRYPPH